MGTKIMASLWLSDETGEPTDELVTITGEINPGCPPSGPSYDCGGDPGEAPFVENIEAWNKDGKSVWLSERDERRAEEALMDEAGLL